MASLRTCLLCESTSKGTGVSFTKKKAICDWCFDQLACSARAWCSYGRHAVPLPAMGTTGRCKPCDNQRTRARARAWYEANKERKRAYQARSEVKERRAAGMRERRRKNPEAQRAAAQRRKPQDRIYRAAHRDMYRETARRWRQRHPERARESVRASRARRKARTWAALIRPAKAAGSHQDER